MQFFPCLLIFPTYTCLFETFSHFYLELGERHNIPDIEYKVVRYTTVVDTVDTMCEYMAAALDIYPHEV